MRLIDADKLEDCTDDRQSLGDIGRYERDCIVNALRYADTVDAMPVKHGKWIEDKGWHCSICNFDNLYPYDTKLDGGLELQHKFCPNCGAKMDEVSE